MLSDIAFTHDQAVIPDLPAVFFPEVPFPVERDITSLNNQVLLVLYGCYIRQKRLQQAAEQIRLGVPVLKAAGDAGFRDYSVFLRAFRGAFGKSPRQLYETRPLSKRPLDSSFR